MSSSPPLLDPMKQMWQAVPTTNPQEGLTLSSPHTSPVTRAQPTVSTETSEWDSDSDSDSDSGSVTSAKDQDQEETRFEVQHGKKHSYNSASFGVLEHPHCKGSKTESCDPSAGLKTSAAFHPLVEIRSEPSTENAITATRDLCVFNEYTDSCLSDDFLEGYETEYPVSEYECDRYSMEDRHLLRLFADEFGQTGLTRAEILSIMKGEEGRLNIFLYL